MDTVLQILTPLLPALYAVCFVNYLLYFLRANDDDTPIPIRLGPLLLVGTVAIHILYAVLLGIAYGHHPMAGLYEVSSFMALALGIMYLFIETWNKNKTTGMFVIPFIFALQLTSSLGIAQTESIDPILRDTPYGMHSSTLTLAYSAFFLSMVYAVMLLLFHRALKQKKYGLIFERLPSFDILSKMNRGAALTGFVLMTLGMFFGLWWAHKAIPLFWAETKIYFTIFIWALYGFTLFMHYVLKWDARRVAVLSLVSFFVMVVLTLTRHLFIPGWHQFID